MSVWLSASSISDYIKCPKKVEFRFKKTVKEIPSREMTIGKIAHLAIERGWRDRKIAYDILSSEVSKNELKKSDLTHLQFMIDVFFLNFADRLGDSDLIEHNFKIQLHDDVFIVGKMDRISRGNIFDWKTATKPPTRLDNDVQSIIYSWAFNKEFDKNPASICVASLTTGELIPYREDTKYVDEIFNNIIPSMIRTVRHDSYEKLGLFNHSCFRCPYKLGCLGGGEDELADSISPE